ncbi:MAG TPA: GNAT family N-acetyltransferase [Longimicrobiaceae bacterium]|nr:GNAT family N-acetyltransferase [Longimicrobiaceae bacterium]
MLTATGDDPTTVVVVPYDDRFRAHFETLNREWIERLFTMEPRDWAALRDPRGAFVEGGGEVLFALVGGEVCGTCALRRMEEGTFELCKLAVRPDARGRGLGDLLLRAAVDAARARGGRRVRLFASTVLAPALALYRKHGFVTTRVGPHPEYARTNLEMVLELARAPVPEPR